MSSNQPPPNWGTGGGQPGPDSWGQQGQWGQQPPGPGSYPSNPGSYPTGPGAQGPASGDPWTGAPGGAPGGPPPGPPKSGRAGLIAAIVALVVVVIAVAVAVVVTLTGDDDSSAADKDPGNSPGVSASPSDEPADEEPSDEPTDEETTPSSEPSDDTSPGGTTDGNRMTGALYSYTLPEGWTDVTDDLSNQPTVDTIAGDGDGLYSSKMHLIVELGSTFGFGTAAELKDTWKATLTGGDTSREITDLEDTTIDGEPAVTVRIDHPPAGNITTTQYGWLLIVDGRAVSIVLTSYADEETSMAVANEILDSWQWE